MRNFLAFLLFVAFFCVGFMGLLYVEGLELFADPIKVFYQWSGWGAYITLVAGMVLPKGKWWGLLSLNLALLHLSVFVFFDFYFDWGLMIAEISKKPYIYMGVGALVLMSVLGVFSFGKRFFPPLRFLVWGAMLLSLAHIVMIQKVLSLWIWGGVGVSLAILCFKVFKSSFSSNFKK